MNDWTLTTQALPQSPRMVETKDGTPAHETKLRYENGTWVTPDRKAITWTPTHWRAEA